MTRICTECAGEFSPARSQPNQTICTECILPLLECKNCGGTVKPKQYERTDRNTQEQRYVLLYCSRDCFTSGKAKQAKRSRAARTPEQLEEREIAKVARAKWKKMESERKAEKALEMEIIKAWRKANGHRCFVCDKDISHRGQKSVRCKKHQAEINMASASRRQKGLSRQTLATNAIQDTYAPPGLDKYPDGTCVHWSPKT